MQYKNTSEAAVAGVKSIAESCISSGTVKRLIYTASIVGASPLKDGTAGNYKESMDETCWTPLTLSIPYSCDLMMVIILFSSWFNSVKRLNYLRLISYTLKISLKIHLTLELSIGSCYLQNLIILVGKLTHTYNQKRSKWIILSLDMRQICVDYSSKMSEFSRSIM